MEHRDAMKCLLPYMQPVLLLQLEAIWKPSMKRMCSRMHVVGSKLSVQIFAHCAAPVDRTHARRYVFFFFFFFNACARDVRG